MQNPTRKPPTSYSQFFTVREVKEFLHLSTVEGVCFLLDVPPVEPSPVLQDYLAETIPIAVASGSEKAKSELIVTPVLVEVRRFLERQVSLFSGEDFTVEESLGLKGRCDFLLSRSPEMLAIEAPVVIIVEAKQADLKTGLGQCLAEMVAAQLFNREHNQQISTIYGSVSNGTQWQFLKLEGQTATIDLSVYSLPPVEQILGFLVWMVQQNL
ncbi:MAG: hypothetical protein GDA56_11340 [Hormoscilla sp. GM7CHS1pb]|nr:hypothetical protein [Hormoscilla sp. GM7CHS1pb]